MEQLSVTHCELARDPPFFCLLFGCVLPARLHTPLYIVLLNGCTTVLLPNGDFLFASFFNVIVNS